MNLTIAYRAQYQTAALSLLTLASLSMPLSLHAQTPQIIRVTEWNVTNYDGTSTRNSAFQTSIYGVSPTTGQSMSPDLFLGEEFLSTAAVTAFKTMLNTAPGSPGDWAAAPFTAGSETVTDTNTAFFYRTSKFNFVKITLVAVGSTSTTNQPRNTYRYDVSPKGFINDVPVLACYATHLKAQGGTNSAGRRLVETTNIRNNANTLTDPNTYFLLGGDFNILASTDPEYQELVGSLTGTNGNVGRFYDPINSVGTWNHNSTFRYIHTQEPATAMNDRYDQILLCSKLLDNVGFDYVYNGGTITNFAPTPFSTSTWNDPNHSYRCWGNDGTSFEAPIKTTGNTEVGATIASALITTVENNGHLPVFLDLKLPIPYVHIGGNVTLEGWKGGGETLEFQFRPVNGGTTIVRNQFVPTTGVYSFTDIPVGKYTLAVKGRKWLRHAVVADGSTSNVSNLNLTLLAGDVDGNNIVDVDDLTDLLFAFNSVKGDGIYTEAPDLDGNNTVDVDDLTLLLFNFNVAGDN